MRRPAALLLALLAITALPAAKPVPPGDTPSGRLDEGRERYRGQGISICVAELRAVPDLSPDDLERICGCAIDRFIESRGTTGLPQLERGRFQGVLEGPLLSCTAETRPDRMGDVARRGRLATPAAPQAPAQTAPTTDDKPAATPEEASAETGGSESGGGLRAWLDGLALPAWLTGVPILWWIAIGIFVFGLLILALRRRDPRRDLSAPPSQLRRGTPPVTPRQPDLPR